MKLRKWLIYLFRGDRDILTLLKIMRQNPSHFKTGLCNWIYDLKDKDIISPKEFVKLNEYLQSDEPKDNHNIYWWKSGLIEPRIMWLDEHIQKNSKK